MSEFKKVKIPEYRKRALRLKKSEAKQRFQDVAVPTKAGIIRSVLRDAKDKRRRLADEKWSADRRAKPSNGLGVGY